MQMAPYPSFPPSECPSCSSHDLTRVPLWKVRRARGTCGHVGRADGTHAARIAGPRKYMWLFVETLQFYHYHYHSDLLGPKCLQKQTRLRHEWQGVKFLPVFNAKPRCLLTWRAKPSQSWHLQMCPLLWCCRVPGILHQQSQMVSLQHFDRQSAALHYIQ